MILFLLVYALLVSFAALALMTWLFHSPKSEGRRGEGGVSPVLWISGKPWRLIKGRWLPMEGDK